MTIIDIIDNHARERGETVALRFLGERGTVEELSFKNLAKRVSAFGTRIVSDGLSGERVIIACKPGVDYVAAVLGCFAGGAIAVPYFPPRARLMDGLAALANDCGAAAILLEDVVGGLTNAFCAETTTFRHVYSVVDARVWREMTPKVNGEIAYLQYTSGSTTKPKGVIVSHENLLANVRMIVDAFALTSNDPSVSWLPLYHDMGLVASIMTPLFVGATSTFMAPMTFARDPLFWIEAISRYRARIGGGPNFCFDLCVSAFDRERLKGLDLSGWTLALNGAESVSATTMTSFAERFSCLGFQYSSFKPAYGLAEATLLVSTVRHDEQIEVSAGPDGQKRTILGRPVEPGKVLLSTKEGLLFNEAHRVGEICISGPAVSNRYWGKRPNGPSWIKSVGGHWLRTGDLGYFDGQRLVVCGRLKEIINVQGRNIYPPDIEQAALTCFDPRRLLALAAVATDDESREGVVLVAELQRRPKAEDYAATAKSLRWAVREALDVELDRIAFVRPGSIPKTSSGKIQRLACSKALKCGSLPILWDERRLSLIPEPGRGPIGPLVESVLGRRLETADWKRTLVELGFDSLRFVRFCSNLRQTIGCTLPPSAIHSDADLQALSRTLLTSSRRSSARRTKMAALSKNQRAVLLLQSRFTQSPRFTIARAVRIRRAPDSDVVPRVVKAFDSIPAAHARLSGVDAEAEFSFDQKVYVNRLEFDGVPSVRCWINARCATPWNLGFENLIQTELLCLPGEIILFIRAHHLICDIHSMKLLLEAGVKAVEQSSGRVPEERPGEVAVRESDWTTEEAKSRAEAALALTMKGPFEFLNLRRAHCKAPRAEAAWRAVELSPQLSQRLRELFRGAGATEFVGMAALFLTSMAHSIVVSDLIIGTAVDTRETLSDAFTVDNFANLTVLRASVQEGISFQEFLERLKRHVSVMADIRGLPFSDLVGMVAPNRNRDALPLFEILFVTHEAANEGAAELLLGRDGPSLEMAGVAVEPVECIPGEPAFDVRLDLVSTPKGFFGRFEYRKGLISDVLIQEIAHKLVTFGERICEQPNEPLEWRPALCPEIVGPRISSAGDLVTEIVETAQLNDASVAIIDRNGEHSYRNLEHRSAAVAAAIVASGTPANSAIAVWLPRCFDMVAALLGVWRAGCCYVPIPLNTPAERRRRLLQLSNTKLLIDVSFMDQLRAARAPERRPPRIAYRLFTSGTTGVPKCVAVTRAGLENLFSAMQLHVPLTEDDRVLASSSIGFDIAGMELWAPLRVGARILLIDAENLLDGANLQKRIDDWGVTVMQATPSGYLNLIATGWRGSSALRLISVGERLEWSLARELVQRSASLWNLYGPTETTIYSTGCQVDLGLRQTHPNGVPIGSPIGNTSLLILDPQLRIVRRGEVGELCIGGAGLAAGYYRDPALTHAKFITVKANGKARRVYRTGDRVRLTPEGLLEYVGRCDRQIKVAGQRLDLGEVEAYLQELSFIRAAYAMGFDRSNGSTEIRAALVPSVEPRPSDREIRRLLRDFAPANAIPTRLRWIPALPLTGNGKIDVESVRSFLSESDVPTGGSPSTTSLEVTIKAIWEAVIGHIVTEGDVTFFDAGGTSLQLVEVRNLLRQRTGIDIPIADLLQMGGIRDFARSLEGGGRQTAQSPLKNRHEVVSRRRAVLEETRRA
jgi:amino acid adenylation domain-containing protein